MSEAPVPLQFGRVSLARVAAHREEFESRWLGASERERASAMRIEKRRIEFVAGRVAARRALVALDVIESANVGSIEADVGSAEGRPVVRAGDGAVRRDVGLSITHAADWAVAVARLGGAVGIDLERVEARDESFVEAAFAPDELRTWRDALGPVASAASLHAIAWTAKEAVLKLEGVGLRAPLGSRAVRVRAWRDGAPPGTCDAIRLDALAWCEADVGDSSVRVWVGIALREGAALSVAIGRED